MNHQKLDEKTQGEIIGEAVAVSYLEQINRLQSELSELKAENETLKRAVSIAERRNGDTSDLMDASQEAQHYDWLDNQNAKLQSELLEAREVIKFYADDENMYDSVYESGGDFIGYIPNEDDFSHIEGKRSKHFGKRAREFMKKFGVGNG